MYYLWKDKASTQNNVIVYLTDYKEVREDGKVKVDAVGWVDAEEVYSSKNKWEVQAFALKL